MNRRQRIPVRVIRTNEYGNGSHLPSRQVEQPMAEVQVREPEPQFMQQVEEEAAEPMGFSELTPEPMIQEQGEVDEWRDRALRLQADMDNYRKRQRRLAQEQSEAERQRLLGTFLEVVDDLERALATESDAQGPRQGVELTQRAALQLLLKEGVEPIIASNQPFDPNWHQAIATAGTNGSGVAPNTVVQVMEPGYRIGERLLRPAKVIVSV